jgi:hypothetical protein
MVSAQAFSSRLEAVRAADAVQPLRREGAYRNGQLLANSDDVSQWDNYDRYFKFYSVYVDDNPVTR